MKRTFVSHWIFPLLRKVSLPSRRTRVERSCVKDGVGQGPRLGLEYLAGSLEGPCPSGALFN